MSIGIGVIGAGVMGTDHARIAARDVGGAHLAAVCDADGERAKAVAAETGAAKALTDPLAVIADAKVDAVLIASPDATHAALTLACLKAGKPVMCEKPLAPTAAECLSIVNAEAALGRRLVQVGFMRRFDPAYNEMKRQLLGGGFGPALMFHCTHRNATAPQWFDGKMAVSNSAVHEFDIARWMLGGELASVSVLKPRSTSLSQHADPLFMTLDTAAGQLVTIEVFMNAGYGYDVRGELVCEKGSIAMTPPGLSEAKRERAQSIGFAGDWRPRFAEAYRLQMREWVASIAAGKPMQGGASAWDGYAAIAVAEAGLRALATGTRETVEMRERPGLYA